MTWTVVFNVECPDEVTPSEVYNTVNDALQAMADREDWLVRDVAHSRESL